MTLKQQQKLLICALCKSRSAFAVGVPKTTDCVPPEIKQSELKKAKVQLYIPRENPAIFPAATCYETIFTICTYTSILFSKSVLSNTMLTVPVTVKTSLTAWQFKIYGHEHLIELSPGLWSTNHSVKTIFSYCCYST